MIRWTSSKSSRLTIGSCVGSSLQIQESRSFQRSLEVWLYEIDNDDDSDTGGWADSPSEDVSSLDLPTPRQDQPHQRQPTDSWCQLPYPSARETILRRR